MRKKPKTSTCCCGRVRMKKKCTKCFEMNYVVQVRERVPYAATKFKTAAWWCGTCRAVHFGKWKYA